MVTANLNGIDIWDPLNGRKIRHTNIHSDESWDTVASLAFNSDGSVLTSVTGYEVRVQKWKFPDMELVDDVLLGASNSEKWQSPKLNSDGTLIALPYSLHPEENGCVCMEVWRIQNPSSTQLIMTLALPEGAFLEYPIFSRDSSFLATRSEKPVINQGAVQLWNIATGELLLNVAGDDKTFSSDGSRLAVDRSEGIDIYEISKSTPNIQTTLQKAYISSPMAFSPDGNILVSSGLTELPPPWPAPVLKTLQLWSTEEGKHLSYFQDVGNRIESLVFSPDSRWLTFERYDGTLGVIKNPFGPSSLIVKGDLTGDGAVSIRDAALALQIALSLKEANSDQRDAADMDGNGQINLSDVILILQTIIGPIGP